MVVSSTIGISALHQPREILPCKPAQLSLMIWVFLEVMDNVCSWLKALTYRPCYADLSQIVFKTDHFSKYFLGENIFSDLKAFAELVSDRGNGLIGLPQSVVDTKLIL